MTTTLENTFEQRQTRRAVLRLGGLALGVGIPLIVSLSAREARAAGSWTGGKSPYGNLDVRYRQEDNHQNASLDHDRPMPYSWRWREEQRRQREVARRYRAQYGGIGEE